MSWEEDSKAFFEIFDFIRNFKFMSILDLNLSCQQREWGFLLAIFRNTEYVIDIDVFTDEYKIYYKKIKFDDFGKIMYNYDQGSDVLFQEVFSSLSQDIQKEILFNIHIFNNDNNIVKYSLVKEINDRNSLRI